MLKKRLIFTLLFENGFFVLSRNFLLQRVGDLNWLNRNYKFSQIAFSIDELIFIDVSRNERNLENFSEHIKDITKECFVPITAGGGVKDIDQAGKLLRSGADKVLVNSLIYDDPEEVAKIAKKYGNQCLVASVDIKKENGVLKVFINNGEQEIDTSAEDYLEMISTMPVGEVYLNSVDKDGTGQGLNFELLDFIDQNYPLPIIFAGGSGHHEHILEGLKDKRVDAVATAHLFNFVGNGLLKCREGLKENGLNLAEWEQPEGSNI